jgi:AraC-like DNA-binding protein
MYQLDSRKFWSDPHVPIQFKFRDPQPPFPLHIHDFHEIALVYSGKATHLTPHGNHDIQGGDFISVKPGQAHGFKNVRNLVLMDVLIQRSFLENDHFGLSALQAYDALFGQDPDDAKTAGEVIIHYRLDYPVFSRAKQFIDAAYQELTGRPDGYRAMVSSLVQQLIVLLIRNHQEAGNAAGYALEIKNLINYVKDNYRSPLNMDVLTGISGMSESHILRAFKRHLGCPPFQYISGLRMRDAAEALIQTGKTITEIALDFGFSDSNYFTRAFRKHQGLSPREYRNKYVSENLL